MRPINFDMHRALLANTKIAQDSVLRNPYKYLNNLTEQPSHKSVYVVAYSNLTHKYSIFHPNCFLSPFSILHNSLTRNDRTSLFL